jgi:hypothetical protein
VDGPDALDSASVTGTLQPLFGHVHQRFREIVGGLDREALNWKPHPDANSIAVLVTHTLGSERQMLAAVRGIPNDRDRAAEFRVEVDGPEPLLELIDRADTELGDHMSAMTAADLRAERPRGDNPPRPGLEMLVNIYGHAREHLAQVELTAQLLQRR